MGVFDTDTNYKLLSINNYIAAIELQIESNVSFYLKHGTCFGLFMQFFSNTSLRTRSLIKFRCLFYKLDEQRLFLLADNKINFII